MDESDEILWLVTHEGTIHYEEVNKLTSAFRAASKTTGLQVTGQPGGRNAEWTQKLRGKNADSEGKARDLQVKDISNVVRKQEMDGYTTDQQVMEESHEVERQKTIIIRRAKKMDKGQTIKMQEKCKQGRWN